MQRWETETLYYQLSIERDLAGDIRLSRAWGRKGTARGRELVEVLPGWDVAEAIVVATARRLARRGYRQIKGGEHDKDKHNPG